MPSTERKTPEKILHGREEDRILHGDEIRKKERAYYRANRHRFLPRKYELVKKRAAERRQKSCVSPFELASFVQNPTLEEERGYKDFIVCRLCGWKARKLSQHLISIHREELATGHASTGKEFLEEYRRRFGYNARAALSSGNLRDHFSKKWKISEARRRHKGGRARRKPFRPGRAPVQAAKAARDKWGISKQAQNRMSRARKHRSSPSRRKRTAFGKSVTDWRIAKLRLQGKEHVEIARKLDPPLDATTVRGRLQRMGFPPGKACIFFRGEAVSEKLLVAHFEDLKFLRVSKEILTRAIPEPQGSSTSLLTTTEAAEFLGVTRGWVYERVRERSKDQIPHLRSAAGAIRFHPRELQAWAAGRRSGKSRFLSTFDVESELAHRLGVGRHRIYEFVVLPGGPRSPRSGTPRKSNHPLSKDLATRLLASMSSLREEFRRSGATASGGRPKSLLPSEILDLPNKYRELTRELNLLLHWAELQNQPITMDLIGEWLAERLRTETAHLLLFWPSLHQQLPAMCERIRNRTHGGSVGGAERAKEIICREYRISRPQLVKVIRIPASKAELSM